MAAFSDEHCYRFFRQFNYIVYPEFMVYVAAVKLDRPDGTTHLLGDALIASSIENNF
jgi:hypothetical protein